MEVNTLLENVSLFDIIIAFFILIFAIKGLVGGFINEFSKLFGWIVGIAVAVRYGNETGKFINDTLQVDLGGKASTTVAGFIVILSLFLLSIYLINTILTNITKDISGLNFLNKAFGFIFGGGKIFLILSIIIGALHGIPLTKTYLFDRFKMDKQKVLFPMMVQTGKYILNLDYVKKSKEGGFEKLENFDDNDTKEL